MPELTWSTKNKKHKTDGKLIPESIIFPHGSGYSPDHTIDSVPNKLILGDNLRVMQALLNNFSERIDLIYVDPPFFSNKKYPVRIGIEEDSRQPQEWRLASGYSDQWNNIDEYLDMLYPRLKIMHQLLSKTGTLYLHLDWHANAYARILLDEIFGSERLINEVAWLYHGPSPIRKAFNRKHDTIFIYTKSKDYVFNVDDIRVPYDPSTVKTFASSPKAGFGKVPDLERGKVPEDWWYYPVVARLHNERTGYPTQKPQALLERIILASSNPGDIIADFFCGSGTTPVIAAKNNRKFIASDITWRAVHTSRSRLVENCDTTFSLYTEKNSPIPEIESNNKLYTPVRNHQQLTLPDNLLPFLDFAEVDPKPGNEVFFSYDQVTRTRGKVSINPVLHLPDFTKPDRVKIRWVTIEGKLQETFV